MVHNLIINMVNSNRNGVTWYLGNCCQCGAHSSTVSGFGSVRRYETAGWGLWKSSHVSSGQQIWRPLPAVSLTPKCGRCSSPSWQMPFPSTDERIGAAFSNAAIVLLLLIVIPLALIIILIRLGRVGWVGLG